MSYIHHHNNLLLVKKIYKKAYVKVKLLNNTNIKDINFLILYINFLILLQNYDKKRTLYSNVFFNIIIYIKN